MVASDLLWVPAAFNYCGQVAVAAELWIMSQVVESKSVGHFVIHCRGWSVQSRVRARRLPAEVFDFFLALKQRCYLVVLLFSFVILRLCCYPVILLCLLKHLPCGEQCLTRLLVLYRSVPEAKLP